MSDWHLWQICLQSHTILRTNQFNLTTKRYTDADVKGFLADGWKIWCISVADSFGDNGITGCIMVNGNEIDTFLLSCRLLGKVLRRYL
jgi:predicted enzyme involved in methoxymalonyl-ACP biosynthesis